MHATDRESYAAAAERLARYATPSDAAGSQPGSGGSRSGSGGARSGSGGAQPGSGGAAPTAAELAVVADELFAVAGVLSKQPRLRRALVAPTRSVEDRVGLLRSLLAGRIGDPALDLAAELVAGRWSRPTELLDATERLGVDALLTSAEELGELATIEDELFRFSQIVAGDARLATTLGDVAAEIPRREQLLRTLLQDKARPTTLRLAEIALIGFGGRSFSGSLIRLVELVAARRERTVAYVTTAVPLQPDQEQRLAATLGRQYGRKISLKTDVDPEVIGGAWVRVGADLYDGTVRRRLRTARNLMTR